MVWRERIMSVENLRFTAIIKVNLSEYATKKSVKKSV